MTLTNNNEKYYFEIDKDKGNLFYFNLKGEEDKILLKSGSYTQKTNCQRRIKLIIRIYKNGGRFGIKLLPFGRYNVYLKAVDGEIITVSADLDKYKEAKILIKYLKCLSHETPVIDKTKIIIHTNNNEKFYFEIIEDYNNLFYFYLKDKEENVYLGSFFPYIHKTSCQEGIESVINNSNNEERFEATQTNYGWVVYLKAGNGRVLAISDYLDTEKEVKSFIKDLKSLSLKTPVIDKTK